ncbi:MAG: TaqI-like C-terminal specificity domain-containing protein [Acidilobus sp.]
MSSSSDICTASFDLRLESFLRNWKKYGAVSTPLNIVRFMLEHSDIKKWEGLNIVEPGCGFCNFLREIYCSHPINYFTGVEVNEDVYKIISKMYPFSIVLADFILWDTNERFDLVIGNPPYGVIGTSGHPPRVRGEVKEEYKKRSVTWKGNYNIYGLFMEKGVNLLKEGGKLVYITPCTYMILDEFSKLREFLSRAGELKVYYLGDKIFKGLRVTTCVTVVTKDPKLSGVMELYDIDGLGNSNLQLRKTNYRGEMIRFENEETRKFEEGKPTIDDLFTIYHGSRSVDYKAHPNVSSMPKPGYICVLKGNNIKPNRIDYEHCYSGLWVPRDSVGEFAQYYTIAHIVVGDTKDGKVVAAVDDKHYPWLEQLHMIPKVPLSVEEMKKIAEYLNSREVQWYMRTLYRDITPHTTITQLKRLPLPKEYERYVKNLTAWMR